MGPFSEFSGYIYLRFLLGFSMEGVCQCSRNFFRYFSSILKASEAQYASGGGLFYLSCSGSIRSRSVGQ